MQVQTKSVASFSRGLWLSMIALSGCASTLDQGGMQADLVRQAREFNQSSLLNKAPRLNEAAQLNEAPREPASSGSNPDFVEELRALDERRPQLPLPFRLAVTPPLGSWPWSPAEHREIRSWTKGLERTGAIRDVVVLPELLFQADGGTDPASWLEQARLAAIRHQADALLVVQLVEDYDEWLTPFSLLDLTIVGMWVTPGLGHESIAVVEGTLIDVRNEFVYGSASTGGSAKETLPRAYLDPESLRERARLQALERLGKRLLEETKRAVAVTTP